MRTYGTILTLTCALIGGCSTSETVAPPPKPPLGTLEAVSAVDAGADQITAKERAIPELYAKALSSPPPDGGAPFAGLVPLLNPDLVQFSSPGNPPAHEPAGIVAAHDALFGAFDDRKLTPSRVWRTANEQSIEWTMTGIHAREWKGVAPTHKPIAFKGLTLIWTKDDGTIIDLHVYFDAALVKAQLSGTGPKELASVPLPTAPSGAPQVFDQTQTGSADEKRNVQVVKASLDALETNEAAYVDSFTDDVEVYTLARAQPARGKADAKAYYKAMHKAIGQLDTSVLNAWGVAQFAVVEYEINGEQLGPILWIPQQRDEAIRWQIVDICEIRDGKIARIWRYDNPLQMVVSAPR